jgi:hypothetical protein
MLHTDIAVRAQGARVNNTHAREATNSHEKNITIKQIQAELALFRWSRNFSNFLFEKK